MRGRCILTDRRYAELRETESCKLFTSVLRQKVCFSRPGVINSYVRLFLAEVCQSFLGNRSYRSGGLKSVLSLIGPFKIGCWVHVMTLN